MRDWQPFGVDPAASAKKPASGMDKLIPHLMKKLGLEQRLHQSQVFFLWQQIVGADVARHAQPVALRKGTLVVAVDHPVWLQELSRYHKPLLLQKVQNSIGKQAVRDIVFRIG
jgi:predicted nucleic acid-binding Zn ribbon protein